MEYPKARNPDTVATPPVAKDLPANHASYQRITRRQTLPEERRCVLHSLSPPSLLTMTLRKLVVKNENVKKYS